MAIDQVNFASEESRIINEKLDTILQHLTASKATKEPDDFITIKETCDILKVSKPTIHRMKSTGKLPFYRIGGGIRFKRSDVEASARKGKTR